MVRNSHFGMLPRKLILFVLLVTNSSWLFLSVNKSQHLDTPKVNFPRSIPFLLWGLCVRDDVHIQLATLNGKLPVLGGWVSGLAVNTWQFGYFPGEKRTQNPHKNIMITHHKYTNISTIPFNTSAEQTRLINYS